MKKFICVLVMLVTINALAIFQYGDISAAKGAYNNPDVSAFVNRGGAGDYGLQNTMHFNQNSYLYINFSKDLPVTSGVYTLDGTTIKDSYSISVTKDGKYTAVDNNGNAVKFSPGDSIGFWITDVNGKVVYNTPKLDGQHQQTYNGTAILDNNKYVIGFGNYGQHVNSNDYDKMIRDSAFVLDIQVSIKDPNGQPLPGVLATLVVGGGLLGWKKFRKNKLTKQDN